MILLLIILPICSMITHHSKYYSQKFTRDGNHGLNLWHAPVDHPNVVFMHDSIGPYGVDSNKKQQFAKIGAPSLGDMPLAAMFSGTDFVKIKTCQFHNFRDGCKVPEISHFANQTGNGYFPNSFDGKNALAIRNLLQIVTHLFFPMVHKFRFPFDTGYTVSDFCKKTFLSLANTCSVPGCFKKGFYVALLQLPKTYFFQKSLQTFKTKINNILRKRAAFQKIQGTLGSDLLNDLHKFGKNNKNKMMQLIDHRGAIFTRSLPCLSKSAQFGSRASR